MLRRIKIYLLLPSFVLILLALGSWGYISSHQQQISAYISSQLSSQLGAPIVLHQATLGFHPTPTLDFNHISFTSADRSLHCTIDKLHVGLSWRDLWHGQLICAKLILLQPQIHWQQAGEQPLPTRSAAQPAQAQQPKAALQIGQLLRQAKIVDGSVFIAPNKLRSDRNASAWELNKVNATISSAGQKLIFTTSAYLHQSNLAPAHIELSGRVQDISANWLDAPIRLAATITKLSGSTIKIAPQYSLNGNYTLQLNINGQRATKLNVVASAKAEHPNQQLSIPGNRQIPLEYVGLNSQLLWGANRISTTQCTLRFNQLILNADLHIDNLRGAAQLHGRLHSNKLPVQDFIPYLPDQISANIPSQLTQLRVQCQNLELEAPLNHLSRATIQQGQINFAHTGITYKGIQAPQFSAQLHWDGTSAQLNTSDITFADHYAEVNGPVNLTLTRAQNASWAMDLDLTPLTIAGAKLISKAAGATGNLHALITPPAAQSKAPQQQLQRQWQLTAGELTIPQYHLLFTASYSARDNYHLDVQLPSYELAAISAKVRLLKRMRLKGNIAASYSLDRRIDHPLHGSGQIVLHDCAISPTYVIAPIHNINGTVDIDNFRLNAPGLKLMLGESPMQVDATIADLRHTVAKLHATGNAVIAKDLLFHNHAMLLNNLDGRIDIHAHGIDFVNASVDLKNGTHAKVTGKLHFRPLLLKLNINATTANINDVIALWHNSDQPPNSGTANAAPQVKKSNFDHEFIHINAHVDHGQISGFAFQNATGKIHYQHGQLRIDPLFFNADNGSGNGTVVVKMRQNAQHQDQEMPVNYSLLKITGNIYNVNADKIYKQLFKHNGIVTGSLSGSFNIQGPIGGSFLAHSQGVFHVDIKNGVLRQFKVLSKAFSLLNVAQLFSLSLPDMDRQGMPFQHLGSDINLINGTLQSDNLIIDSQAMGLTIVGKHDLVHDKLDLVMGVKALGTVDTVVNNLPLAGWILAGDDKTLIAPNFSVTGSAHDPQVRILAVSSLADKLFGIMERTITLPSKLIKDPLKILTNIGN